MVMCVPQQGQAVVAHGEGHVAVLDSGGAAQGFAGVAPGHRHVALPPLALQAPQLHAMYPVHG
jgi:hypothetical protein